MKTRLFLFLCFLPLFALAESKDPLFIVDGQVGVTRDQLPPADSVYSTSTLTADEAMYAYGERAANGVLIIYTHHYIRHINDPRPRSKTFELARQFAESKAAEDLRKNQSRHVGKRSWAERILMPLFAFVLFFFVFRSLKKDNQPMLSDEEYRRIIEDGEHPCVPLEMQRQGVDPLMPEVAMYVVATGRTDADAVRNYYKLPAERADKILSQLEHYGIVSAPDAAGRRKPLLLDLAELNSVFEPLNIDWKK